MRNFDPLALYDPSGNYWVRAKEDRYLIGLSDWGQYVMGPVTEVLDPPQVDQSLQLGEVFMCLTTDKASTDLILPISGKITAVNEQVLRQPSLINTNCYAEGWLIEVQAIQLRELELLQSAERYIEEINSLFRKQ